MSYDTELAFAKELALQAGAIIKQAFDAGTRFQMKLDNSPVTEVDKRVNSLVADAIRAGFPDHALKGEEESFGDTSKGSVWLCDPIDGTIPFLLGVPSCCFMLALFVDGEAQVAVVYNPNLDLFYSAVRGKGAFCNGQQIHVRDIQDDQKPYVVLDAKILREEPEWVDRMEQAGFPTACTSGTGEKLMLVARGRACAFVRSAGEAEDIGVGAFIIEEAGGVATSVVGGRLLDEALVLRNGYIIGAPRAHTLLLETYRESQKNESSYKALIQ